MKKIFLTILICALFAPAYAYILSDSTSTAQDTEEVKKGGTDNKKKPSKFGSFMRKAGEVTTGINMTNEQFSVVPLDMKPWLDVELAGCYGDKASGAVTAVILLKAKSVPTKTTLGDTFKEGRCAYDKKGNLFAVREAISSITKENPVGVPVKYELTFNGVPATLDALELVQLGWYIYKDNGNIKESSRLQFRNVPIQWDVVPE